MRNLFFLLCLMFTFLPFSIGQTILIEESFDSFNNGDKLVQSVGNQELWDTWSSNPGGSDDAAISNAYANSPENSLYLANNKDILLLFNDLTEGRYKLEFMALIQNGRIGYFNMLQDFAGNESEWAFQVFFNPNGLGAVDAAGADAANFNYEYDTWIPVEIIVDLDDDFSTLYLNNEEILSWKWSLGSFGGGSLKKLDAANFYGITQGGTSGMYVDDVIFKEVPVPESPINLTAEVEEEKTVLLNWEEPTTKPDNYTLSRNNEIIATNLTDIFFSESPYPGDNVYNVRAHTIGSGYSHASNDAIALIPGGLDREYVLFEIGTGTGCPYCPGASMGAEDMVETGDHVIIVKYHNFNSSDPFNNPESAERASNYYGIKSYPTSIADGHLKIEGGSATQSLYEGYHQHYLQRKNRKALYSLDLNVFHLSGNDYRAEITVEQHSAYNSEQKTLHTVLTETDIDYAWQNQSKVNWTCRKMFPDALGTTMDFSVRNQQSMTMDFSLEEDYVKDNCEFAVFLQADPSKEVMVAAKVDMADVLLKEDRIKEDKALRIYPNPAGDYLFFENGHDRIFRLMDVTGKIIMSGKTNDKLNMSGLKPGIYYLDVSGFSMQKIVKKD